ncbi:MAG: flavodoxin domain-containing protein [Desulfobacteraceae bacterium]|jgi:menaquinone-dependent protoporphyrinogen IX oxidase
MERRDFIKAGVMGLGALAIADKSMALEYYPKKSDKKWAVIYSTWCGSSRDAGVWISEGLGGIADVFDVRENPDPSKYDNIVVGGSIRMGKVSQEMQDYLAKNKSQLKSKVRGLFAVCGNGEKPVGPTQKATLIDNHLAKLCEVSKVSSSVFNGRITQSLMEPDIAKMMKDSYPRIAGKKLADYDLLKRSACLAFGKEILDSVK